MQTILGANGQIAEELAKELHRNYTTTSGWSAEPQRRQIIQTNCFLQTY